MGLNKFSVTGVFPKWVKSRRRTPGPKTGHHPVGAYDIKHTHITLKNQFKVFFFELNNIASRLVSNSNSIL